jgi:hypothetical protein
MLAACNNGSDCATGLVFAGFGAHILFGALLGMSYSMMGCIENLKLTWQANPHGSCAIYFSLHRLCEVFHLNS